MVSHLLASLSHPSLAAVVHLRPLFTPFSFSKPPTSLLLSSTTTKSRRKFHLYPSNCGKLQQRPSPSCNIVSDSSRSVSMDSPSISTDLSVDSVANDLKKQSLGDENVKFNLEDLNWDNSFVRELPGDPRADNIPRQVLHACYTKVSPSVEVENPQLVAWSKSVAELLDLDPKEFERPDFPLLFSGASPLVGAVPYAQCYGGHQFGTWAGQLGDGRAITLGEVLNSKSERWELQLKGAGKTPYSRFADGLAVLRSSIREFLCSEAMQSLGIPTTRALCLVATGKYVTRDMFYDGNPKDEPGAIVYRVAQSFLRFGSYQIHASRGKEDLDIVRTLADYIIRHHFPHIENMSKSESLSFNTGMEDDSVVINLVVWDKHSSFVGTIGLLICMMGGVMYQQSISNKSKAVKEVRFQESEQEQLEIFISLLPYLEVLLLPVTRLCCTFMLL